MPGHYKAQGLDGSNKCRAVGSRSETLVAFTCVQLPSPLRRVYSVTDLCASGSPAEQYLLEVGGGRVGVAALMQRVTRERVQVFQDAEVVVQLIASDVDVEGDAAHDADDITAKPSVLPASPASYFLLTSHTSHTP